MSKTLQGVYRDGRIELLEEPNHDLKDGPVLITFLEAGEVDLQARGIDEKQAASLRTRLARFAEEWDSSEMQAYDDYDASKSSRDI